MTNLLVPRGHALVLVHLEEVQRRQLMEHPQVSRHQLRIVRVQRHVELPVRQR
jgi:hypothetical protein